MRVTWLKIANLRTIDAAEFRFQPGFNLIVGVNGVGKTSVLDALRACLSGVVKHANKLRVSIETFAVDDIRAGANALSVECGGDIRLSEFRYLIHKPREASAPQEGKVGMPREQVHSTPEQAVFRGKFPKPTKGGASTGRPLAVLYSTNRAVPSVRAPSKGAAVGGPEAAFAGAFASRELRLAELAAWMRVQEALQSERPSAGRALAAFENAVSRFLPGYAHLRVDGKERPRLLVDRGHSTVAVRQMSDGERGTLAVVLDLTRRLVQANPELIDPVAEAEAVVLIDEVDLHLHPKWQRQIVHNLTVTFPRCQFIATTHSPQVIGEVEHDRIQIMEDGRVYPPRHSFGVDSSRVLEEVMDTNPRTQKVQELLSRVSQQVGKKGFDRARASLAELVERLGDNDPDVTRVRTLLDFMEGDE